MRLLANHTGLYVFLIRYWKILTALNVFLLLAFPFEVWTSPRFTNDQTYQEIGFWLDTFFMYLFLPIWFLMYIRKARKAYSNDEEWKKVE